MRYDLQIIASWIEPGSRVLDLGCGAGDLLKFLINHKQVKGVPEIY
jgi:cyclopropane fatty-acyl-phospholipid synthase-like methyltransferase